MAADLFETYAVTVVATMVLAAIFFAGQPILDTMLLYPLAIGAACIVTSIIGTFFVKLGPNQSIMGALYKGLIATGVLSVVGLALVDLGDDRLRPRSHGRRHFTGMAVLVRARRPRRHRPIVCDHRVLYRHRLSARAVHRPGIGHGPRHQRDPGSRRLARIDGATRHRHHRRHHRAFTLAGLFGIAIAVTAMLGVAGMIVALDAFGPVTDNAGGIAEMAGLPKEVRKSTDALDAVGNTTKAVTKGYAIGSAGLGALVLFAAYTSDLTTSPRMRRRYPVFRGRQAGLLARQPLCGGRPPVRRPDPVPVRRHRHDGGRPGRRRGGGGGASAVPREAGHHGRARDRPDYGRAVDMLTRAAIKEMIVPSLLPVLAPIVTYFVVLSIAGKCQAFSAVGAMLLGVIVTGLFVAISMTSGGGAWDNAKKSFEDGFTDEDGCTTTRVRKPTRRPSPATPSATPTRTRRARP